MQTRQEAFSGTKEVDERLRFDVQALSAYLRDHLDGFDKEITVEQFKGGQSNPTYLIETVTGRFVPAPQAARQAAQVRARGRPRVPGVVRALGH